MIGAAVITPPVVPFGAPATFQQLITPVSQPQFLAQIMAGHQTNGVPWQSWLSPKNVGLSLSQIMARLLACLSGVFTQTARGMFLGYSTGVPLTQFALSQYQLPRTPAQFTAGQFLLTGVAAMSSYTFSAGQVTAGTPGPNTATSRLFVNQEGGSLTPGQLVIAGGGNGLQLQETTPGATVTFEISAPGGGLSLGVSGLNTVISLASDANGNAISTCQQVATAITNNGTTALTPTVLGTGSFVPGAIPTIALDGGALSMNFIATQPGAAWNLPVGTPLVLKTSFPGVSVSNPAWLNGTWITSQGSEQQADPVLALLCASRWGTLGVGGNSDAFVFWAFQTPNGYAATPVAQAVVFPNYYNGTFASGAATVVVVGPNGQLGSGDVAAVQANFDSPITNLGVVTLNGQSFQIPGLNTIGKKYPINCRVYVASATNLACALTGTVSVYRRANADLGAVAAAVSNAITAYQQTILIGEELYPVGKIDGVISQAAPYANAIAKVDLSSTNGGLPFTPSITQYPQLSVSGLAYQLVDQ